MKFDIVTFGSAVVDNIIKTKFEEKNGNIIIPYGCKILINELFFEIGGGGTNTAVAFSRLGLRTGYIGKLGSDSSGNKILNSLKKEKIHFLGKIINGETSGFSAVLLTKGDHRSILTYKGVNDKISGRDIQKFETKWLYLSSLMEMSYKTQFWLAKKLKDKGVKIAFNPSEYQIKAMDLRPMLKLCDVVVMNDTEAGLLTGKKEAKEKIKKIHELGPKIIAITNEEKTVHCSDGLKFYSINPKKIKVVDKTGAGDAFASGFVAGLVKDKNIEFCLNLGMKEAASVVKHLGAKNDLIRMKLK